MNHYEIVFKKLLVCFINQLNYTKGERSTFTKMAGAQDSERVYLQRINTIYSDHNHKRWDIKLKLLKAKYLHLGTIVELDSPCVK